jgi:5-hydroxyisourate hydrolase
VQDYAENIAGIFRISRKVIWAQRWVACHPLSCLDGRNRKGVTMGRLSTHVLDTARGKPAAGVRITLYRISGQSHRKVKEMVTNADGRTDGPMLEGALLTEGQYELVFAAGDYLRASGQAGEGLLFLDEIPIRFGVPDATAHYHVPLLISPFGYSTYRGS